MRRRGSPAARRRRSEVGSMTWLSASAGRRSPPSPAARAGGSRLFGEDRVLVRVRRRAAAQQHERLVAGVPQLVRKPGRDHDRVAGPHVGLLPAEPHAPRAGGEVVDLLRLALCGDGVREGRLVQRLHWYDSLWWMWTGAARASTRA